MNNNENLVSRVKDLSEIIAKVTVQLSNGTGASHAEVPESLVSEVLDCFLVNLNCTLLRRIGNQFNSTANLPNSTLSRYSGVRNSFAVYLRNISLDFSMKDLSKIVPSVEKCNATYTQNWAPIIVNDTCFGYVVNSSSATSPAFKLKDYSSTKYSTWTESRWSPNFRVRLFLMDSTSDNVTLLCCGLLYFLVLSGLIFQCHRQSDDIFPQ